MASESGSWLNLVRVILVGGCVLGVVGMLFTIADDVVGSDKMLCEVKRIECLAVEGDGPVAGCVVSSL